MWALCSQAGLQREHLFFFPQHHMIAEQHRRGPPRKAQQRAPKAGRALPKGGIGTLLRVWVDRIETVFHIPTHTKQVSSEFEGRCLRRSGFRSALRSCFNL